MRTRKLLDFDKLHSLRALHPTAKIVHCHGVFDVLHAGHLAYFESAKKLGQLLVVTITADPYVNKGPGRPYFNSAVRANMLASLEIVDFVVINNSSLAVPAIEALKPHFYVKGPDYKDRGTDITGGILAEELAVKQHGGQLIFTDDTTFSSSTLLNKYFSTWTDEQSKIIDEVKKAGGFDLISEILERIAQERVLVVGEPIVDTYIFCLPQGISSKSPSISARFQFEENYAGGSLAIANHLVDFVKDLVLLITNGNEPYFEALLAGKIDRRVRLETVTLPNIPTPRKTRFIDSDKGQRIFEVTDIRSDQWLMHDPAHFHALLGKAQRSASATIVADFGHGLFENSVLESMRDFTGFVGLNVQTNSSNFGFNPFTKHSRYSYLSVDTQEIRLAYHDRFASPIDLARKLRGQASQRGASTGLTLGSGGAYYFPKDASQECFAPAFADSVVDATGAGDAYFALTSLLVKVGCPDVIVPFLGNIYAGLKTRIIGNKASVTRAQLVKAVTAVLK